MKMLVFVHPIMIMMMTGVLAGDQSADDQSSKDAAKKAFDAGSWNPEIFEAREIKIRSIMLNDGDVATWLPPNVLKSIETDFGKGPFTIVSYFRKPETLKENSGAPYCSLHFLVFSPTKVATIDGRAYPCPKDKVSNNSTKAEQAGAGQAATRSESDSEGADKLQPESEGRSQ